MKLAIIIPAYNAEDTIKRAILSVDTQSDYEIICVNDGSTDNTKRVLTELQKYIQILRSLIKITKVQHVVEMLV